MIKIKSTTYPENRPSFNEWAKEFRVSQLYCRGLEGETLLDEVISYARQKMKVGYGVEKCLAQTKDVNK